MGFHTSFSQNEPNVNPEHSISREPIPFINLNNGQVLDSIYYYMKDPNFLSKRNYISYNSVGLKVKSISYSRHKEKPVWWQSYEGRLIYDKKYSLIKETQSHLKYVRDNYMFLTFEYKYDSADNLSCAKNFFWSNGKGPSWDFGETKHFYTDNGLLVKTESRSRRGDIVFDYDFATQDYTYHENGKLKDYTLSFYSNRQNKLDATTKDIFLYDTDGNLTTKYYYQWDRKKNEWALFAEIIYKTENNLITETIQYEFENNAKKITSNKFFVYDNHRLTHYFQKKMIDSLQEFTNENKESFEYNDQNQLVNHIKQNWDIALNDWYPHYKKSWTYNDYGNISEIDYYYFNKNNSKMELNSRRLYFWNYSDSLDLSKNFQRIALCEVFPNPVSTRLTIRILQDDFLPITYHLTKITGEVVLSGQINSHTNSINMDKLASEIYILTLQSGRSIQTEKIYKY